MQTGDTLYCPTCNQQYYEPRLLSCLHTLCFGCITKIIVGQSKQSEWKIQCPICSDVTNLPVGGPECLPINLVLLEKIESDSVQNGNMICTSCKSGEKAKFRCSDCSAYLCKNCVSSHKFMKCFSDHTVIPFNDLKRNNNNELILHRQVYCQEHNSESVKFFCQLCQVVGCGRCLSVHSEHSPVALDNGLRGEFVTNINKYIGFSQEKVNYCVAQSKHLISSSEVLENQKRETTNLIEESFELFYNELIKKKESLFQNLNKEYNDRKKEIRDQNRLVNDSCNKLQHAIMFSEDYMERASVENMAATHNLIGVQLMKSFNSTPPYIEIRPIQYIYDFSNFSKVVENGFGYFVNSPIIEKVVPQKEFDEDLTKSFSKFINLSPKKISKSSMSVYNNNTFKQLSPYATSFSPMNSTKTLNRSQSLNSDIISHSAFNKTMSDSGISVEGGNYQDMVSKRNFLNSDSFGSENDNSMSEIYKNQSGYSSMNSPTQSISSSYPGVTQFSETSSNSLSPISSKLDQPSTKISAMQIRTKFGQLGCSKLQFNSPHGFCLGVEEDIIIADTNNHRIQVYTKNGEFCYMFGNAGREEGQLWYPRKVAVIRHSGNIIICDRGNERSRMQMFSKHGVFIKKIIIKYIDIVAGLAVSPEGHIIAVDSVSPTVFRISENGDLIKWFDCSEYMREPSDIAIWKDDYYVCDFKGHCVVVFNNKGKIIKKIGHETLTSFPNGIDISDNGDILVGDSHGNRFHIAVFLTDGTLVGEFECPYVKVSRCCGLKISSEGYVITLAKNNHHVLVLHTLYIA